MVLLIVNIIVYQQFTIIFHDATFCSGENGISMSITINPDLHFKTTYVTNGLIDGVLNKILICNERGVWDICDSYVENF